MKHTFVKLPSPLSSTHQPLDFKNLSLILLFNNIFSSSPANPQNKNNEGKNEDHNEFSNSFFKKRTLKIYLK